MFPYLKTAYQSILFREPELLNKARIRILIQALCAYLVLSLILLCFYIIKERDLLLVRMVFQTILFSTGLFLLMFGASWRRVGHYFIVCISLIIWTNALFFHQMVNMVTVQYVLLIVSGGYYILGASWGLTYSIVNILPVIIVVLASKYTGINFSIFNQNINEYTFDFVLVFNFIILILIHYFFFKAFQKTNQKEQELKVSLQQAMKETKQMASAKINFLSTMSHELRTPLNAVVGMVNLLKDGNQVEQKENLEILAFSAENLMAIINDILDFNKIDAGMLTLEQHDFRLDLLLKNVFGAFKAEADKKSINYTCVTSPGIDNLMVKGDQTRLTQILFNLVGNAIKFTPTGHVLIECIVKSIHGDQVNIHFKVEDSGIGISSDQQIKIFEPFIQTVTRTKRQHHGTGLGLTIASRLVALHGSKLALDSVEGTGTTVQFELVYQIANQHTNNETVSIVEQPATSHKLRMLVAEDNALNVLVLKKFLTKWGIDPTVVENGKDAVEAVIKEDFDVILMDINMPVMDGFEASRIIRELADVKKSKTHIIALTASVGTRIEDEAGHKYLDDWVLKPFDPKTLKEKLERLRPQ